MLRLLTAPGIISRLALLIGLLLTLQGILGLAAPEAFLRIVRFMQTPPVIYLAAVVRVGFGVVLLCAAHGARVPNFLRVFGFLILLGGLLTPFFGLWIGRVILEGWSAGGPALIRGFAGISLALGVSTVYAVGFRAPSTIR